MYLRENAPLNIYEHHVHAHWYFPDLCLGVLQAADEPAYLTVGTDVSAKYRGAFCEAKIKTVKRMVKVKVRLREVQMSSERTSDLLCCICKSVLGSCKFKKRVLI